MNSTLKTSELVDQAKRACGITKFNNELVDDQIRSIVHWIGMHAPDTDCTNGEVTFHRIGLDLMLFITLTEFPWFYSKYELAQFN